MSSKYTAGFSDNRPFTVTQRQLQKLIDKQNSNHKKNSTPTISKPIQRYVLDNGTYPYTVYTPDDFDEASQTKIANTLVFFGLITEPSEFFTLQDQITFSQNDLLTQGGEFDTQRTNGNYIYVYDNINAGTPKLEKTCEVSDVVEAYNVKKACVLQALIAIGAVDESTTAQDLHDELWEETSPKHKLYDLDEIYPKLYETYGFTKEEVDEERLDTLVDDGLEAGKWYIMIAKSSTGGMGHSFTIDVRRFGKKKKRYNKYFLHEDSGNPGGVSDSTTIIEYWSKQ